MLTYGEAVGRLDRELFVGRERELATFGDWLWADRSEPELLNISGASGIGKSALMRAFYRAATELGVPARLVDARVFPTGPDALLNVLGGSREPGLCAQLNETRRLILLDHFEEMAGLARDLWQKFLPRLRTSKGRHCWTPAAEPDVGKREWLAQADPLLTVGGTVIGRQSSISAPVRRDRPFSPGAHPA